MTDVPRNAKGSVEAFVRALHRRQLTYTARVAPSVLLPAVAGEGPRKVSVLDPFGDAPALVVGDRAIPTADFAYDAEELRWASGAGADRTTGLLRFRECGPVASGAITTAANQYAVEMSLAPPVYDCLLSADAGAHVSTTAPANVNVVGSSSASIRVGRSARRPAARRAATIDRRGQASRRPRRTGGRGRPSSPQGPASATCPTP